MSRVGCREWTVVRGRGRGRGRRETVSRRGGPAASRAGIQGEGGGSRKGKDQHRSRKSGPFANGCMMALAVECQRGRLLMKLCPGIHPVNETAREGCALRSGGWRSFSSCRWRRTHCMPRSCVYESGSGKRPWFGMNTEFAAEPYRFNAAKEIPQSFSCRDLPLRPRCFVSSRRCWIPNSPVMPCACPARANRSTACVRSARKSGRMPSFARRAR